MTVKTAKRVLVCIMVLLSCMLPPAGGIESNEEGTPSLLRLHVRAHSDEPSDQALKYEVKNAVLHALAEPLREAESHGGAEEKINELMPLVLEAAELAVEEAGFEYSVSAEVGEASFPTRLYGSRVYRAGRYRALQLEIGSGEGENWWCVLFPPLCFIEVTEKSPTDNTADVSFEPRPKSRLLEWAEKILWDEENNFRLKKYFSSIIINSAVVIPDGRDI